jgi:hypothetical protein
MIARRVRRSLGYYAPLISPMGQTQPGSISDIRDCLRDVCSYRQPTLDAVRLGRRLMVGALVRRSVAPGTWGAALLQTGAGGRVRKLRATNLKASRAERLLTWSNFRLLLHAGRSHQLAHRAAVSALPGSGPQWLRRLRTWIRATVSRLKACWNLFMAPPAQSGRCAV